MAKDQSLLNVSHGMCKDLMEAMGKIAEKHAEIHGTEDVNHAMAGTVAMFTGVMLSNLTKKGKKEDKAKMFTAFDSLYREIEGKHTKQIKETAKKDAPKPTLN